MATVEQGSTTANAETHILRVNQDSLNFEFLVHLSLGEWETYRKVTVTDPTIDVAEAMRRVQAADVKTSNAWDVSRPDMPDGTLLFYEGERKYVVGRWEIDDSMMGVENDLTPTIELSIVDIRNGEIEVSEADLPALRIELTE